MSDMMTFPDTWEEYEKSYGFTDNEEVYTNGSRLIPSFRVKQWLDHLPSTHSKLEKNSKELENKNGELISRQAAVDALKICDNNEDGINCHKCPLRDERWDGAWQDDETNCYTKLMRESAKLLEMPSAQSERDIPVKPIETTDKAWGIPNKQAVCPKCDYYLSHISFLGDYKGKRITYCETCGQAIDWEGWDWDEED